MFSWSFLRRFWERPAPRAALATLPVLAVTAWLFFESRHSERLLLEAETSRQADNAFLQFQNFVGTHVDLLKDVGSYVLTVPEETAERSFTPFVNRLLSGSTDFVEILWRDAAGTTRRASAGQSFAPAPPAWAAGQPDMAERKAAATLQPASTQSFSFQPDHEAMTVVVPLVRAGQCVGFVDGTIHLTGGMRRLFGRDVLDFWHLEVYDRTGRCAYQSASQGMTGQDTSAPVAEQRHVPVADQAWRLRILPTSLLVSSLHTGAPWRILGIGLTATLLLALANGLLTQHQARLAASLRESERLTADVEGTRRRLSELVNGIDAAIWESDADLRRFTFVNDHARALLGIETAEWVAEPAFWLEHVHPEDRERAFAHTRGARSPGDTTAAEYRLIDAHQQTVWVREIVTAIGTDGRVTGWRGVVVDITARVQAEDALRQSQKLESLGVLAGGIAHDFNNLLTTILGNAEMLKPFLDGRSQAGYGHLDKIERTTRRLADLTRQMLAYSGRGRFSVERIDLNATLREMAELLSVSTPKNVRVSYQLDPGSPLMDAAVAQIRQVILNLLTNAAEAIGEAEGSVILQTRALDLDAETAASLYPGQDLEPGRYVSLQVSDDGCGMSEETLSKIFDPFFTTKFTGRGLGLAALRGIVRGHHGGIRISSQPGEGTVFTLLFPALDALGSPPPSNHPASPTPSDLDGATVLVVDDEESLRSLMVDALEGAGCNVHQAVDGLDGIAQFQAHEHEIDAVVLDVTMPRLNGDEVFRRLRSAHPTLPIVLCSGYTEEDISRRFDGLGLTSFLEKPFKPSELVALVGQVLADAPTRPEIHSLPSPAPVLANGNHNGGRKVPSGKP